jgi:eukaryotic-like serine/threonine-protein kinase
VAESAPLACPSCGAPTPPSAASCDRCGATFSQAPTAVLISIDLGPGTLFHGRYEIRKLLGRGGMGMVYEAFDRTLEEIVAIKILLPDFARDPAMARRFKSEIKLARRVRHKNVCSIHDFGEEQGLLFISMERVEGTDLKKVLKRRGGLPQDDAYSVAIQVSEGLQAVHDAGIVHRDLKGPNIMLDDRGVVRLMDFGIAKRQGAERTLTATGQIVGTPEYMSPEQAQGQPVDFRSDTYALGIVTWEIFTGRVPFRGDTPISTILKQIHDAPPLEGDPARSIPAHLKPVLARALSKDPEQRYATASEFAQALRRAQREEGEAFTAPTIELRSRAPSPSPARVSARGVWLAAAGLAAAAAVSVWLTVGFAGGGRAPTAGPGPSSSPTAAVAPIPDGGAAPPTPPQTTRPAPLRSPTPTPTPTPTPRPRATPSPVAPSAATPPPTTQPRPTTTTVPSGVGELQVVVRPWGQVDVDGRQVGTTPFPNLRLPAGRHVLRVRHPAYEDVERVVTVDAGAFLKVVVDLPREAERRP